MLHGESSKRLATPRNTQKKNLRQVQLAIDWSKQPHAKFKIIETSGIVVTKKSEREKPHCRGTHQHALTQTWLAGCMGFVWVHADLFLHCVASPFHSCVTTHKDPMQPASQP